VDPQSPPTRASRRLPGTLLASAVGIGALLYALALVLQRSDAATIEVAREVDAFIIQYCASNKRLATQAVLRARFPGLNVGSGWFFFTDDKTYLKMQYPMKWWNDHAIGERKLSEFTATPYAYVVEYHCGNAAPSAHP